MNREAFGVFGSLGSRPVDDGLAKALILAGLLPDAFAAQFGAASGRRIPWGAQFARFADKLSLDPFSNAVTVCPDLIAAQRALRRVSDGWARTAHQASLSSTVQELWAQSIGTRFPRVRLAVTPMPEAWNPQELTQLLMSPGTGVGSVFFKRRVETPLQWNWPLQIGVPRTPVGERLLKILKQGRYQHLYQPRVISGKQEAFDLLLLPGALVPDAPLPFDLDAVHAGALLVLEEKLPASADSLRPFAGFALHRSGFGLTGACFVAQTEWPAWINTVMRELSHKATLDAALFQASKGPRDHAQPLLAADPDFLERARFVKPTLRSAAVPSADVPRMQKSAKPPATVVFRSAFPMAVPAGIDISATAKRAAAKKIAPVKKVKKPAEERHVQCKILKGKSGSQAVKRLECRRSYRAHIHIGPEIDLDALRADVVFDESQLPPSDDGHDLQVAFCPLDTSASKDGVVPAMVKTIHLPKVGPSEVAQFNFTTGADAQGFRARVLIMHRTRILQTLMLAAPTPNKDVDTDLALRQESVVNPAFSSSASEKPADIALVGNDSAGGFAGITAVTAGGATFSEPAGLNVLVDTIESLLSKANISTAGEDMQLDDPKLVALMIQLASQGVALTRELKRQMNLPDFQNAKRVQVVEARSKAYLPVEFVYTGKAPTLNARLCPNARKALAAGGADVHGTCKNAGDSGTVCPAAFWGFSKCIERQPFGLTEQHVFSIPQPGADTLAPFKAAVLAASEKVTAADLTGAAGVKTAIAEVAQTVRMATSWDDWQKDIRAKPAATLLVLLPHSDLSLDFVNMPALEIQKSWLTSVQLDEAYVLPPNGAGPGPVVLLLGCSTALADIPFLNFVREFKAAGASIVLGTLATVHGTHATRFVRALLGKIHLRGTGRPFDEILLEVKREMLAEGEPFVLSLAAYGHSSWRIQT